MVFSSLIFLWLFLPIVFCTYFVVKDQFKNVLLLVMSLIFYAWGEPRYVALMIIVVLINWIFGMAIEKSLAHRKLFLIGDIIINLAILAYFKYYNFFVEIVNGMVTDSLTPRNIVLPIGISFFTFQILSYIIDLYRGKYMAQKNIINLALYISFFPQLIAGPIVRYSDIDKQIAHRDITYEKVALGIRRFIYGLGKKVIISNTMAKCVDIIFGLNPSQVTGLLAWLAAIMYTLQIYYDFSGYSDMAIGLGSIFGFKFNENFKYPYMSCSIREFWQRWHISLGTWFKEYVYIPLGGNRKGSARTYVNLIIVFFLTGLWHGASFNFIIWGLYHGFFQIIERMGIGKKILERHKIVAHIYAMMVIVFGWVLFRAENIPKAISMYSRMILPYRHMDTTFFFGNLFGSKTILIMILGLIGCGPIQYWLHKSKSIQKAKNGIIEMLYCACIFILSIMMLASNVYNPFIYFRF